MDTVLITADACTGTLLIQAQQNTQFVLRQARTLPSSFQSPSKYKRLSMGLRNKNDHVMTIVIISDAVSTKFVDIRVYSYPALYLGKPQSGNFRH